MEGLVEERAQQGGRGPHFRAIPGKTEKATADAGCEVTGKGGDETITRGEGVQLRGSLQVGQGSEHVEASGAPTASSSSDLPPRAVCHSRTRHRVDGP